jgi:hypothetical protein
MVRVIPACREKHFPSRYKAATARLVTPAQAIFAAAAFAALRPADERMRLTEHEVSCVGITRSDRTHRFNRIVEPFPVRTQAEGRDDLPIAESKSSLRVRRRLNTSA